MQLGSIFVKIIEAGNVGAVLDMINVKLGLIAETLKLPAILFFILGAAVAIFVGVCGYKYIKLLSSIFFGLIGYAIGSELFYVAKTHFAWEKLPDACVYIAGVLVLALFAFLAYKKFSYALFGVMGVAGFVVFYFIIPNISIAIAGAIAIALLSMFFIRYAFIILTSLGSGFVLLSMMHGIAPNISLLNVTEGYVGLFLALVASLIFVAIQFYISRKEAAKHKGPKRVKIRRIFDTW